MNLYLFDEREIVLFTLPENKIGNFWMTDENGKNVINIVAKDNEWVLSGSNNSKIINGSNYVDNMILKIKSFYMIEKNDKRYLLFADNILDNTFNTFNYVGSDMVSVGSGSDCVISYAIQNINNKHISLVKNSNSWNLSRDNDSVVYVNNYKVLSDNVIINNGDVINIYGLKIIVAFNVFFINNPLGNIRINSSILNSINVSVNDEVVVEEIIDEPLYNDDDYFYKSPRIRRVIERMDMNIDSPPSKVNDKGMPMLYTLGPMLTMGASSAINITDTVSRIGSGERTWGQSLPSLAISSAMLCSMLLWPFLTKRFEKKQKIKNEEKRQLKYKAYIGDKRKELIDEYNRQIQILEENLLSSDVCYDTILNKKRTLWERKIDQIDFLTVRVGRGQIPFDAQINYQTADFSMDDDNLIQMLEDLGKEFSVLNNVPVSYSFAEDNITAINGLYPKYLYFTYNCLLQLMAYHSYDNLKIVVFTNNKNASRWDFLKESLYCFSDNKSIRFFAVNNEEMQEVSNYLNKIFYYRKDVCKNNNDNSKKSYMLFNSYYLIIIDDIDLARKVDIVKNVLDEKTNVGFSLLILENRLSKLPSQCTNFFTIGDKSSGILKNDVISNTQIQFKDEIGYNYDMEKCSYILSNVPIYFENGYKSMPNVVTFLELFGVGEVEQLNVLNRWKKNDPTKSLKTVIGVNQNCDPFILDLHEKAHGPHGLIAGMTGSGKSEFIITFVLSMAVNYSPEEVSFVLIDYKGGGLTGAFENKELGIRLPHVVGTITNLDKTEINRALSSINSELRRRQQRFNEVKEATGESTIDIYKYQTMYRDGKVSEPMPHLIIVSDEFAELKAQQPDFMADLVSTARIGRSLGVHLILATQKPTGVVDGQIWSNSKFKVCLKVQDREDSMEMIKRADAAELKNVGRFYLQVGYDEYFAMGQSAWAGSPYYPSKEFKKQVDKNLYFIDNVGSVYKAIDNTNNKRLGNNNGEELSNVLKYIVNVSNNMNFKIKNLWMDRLSDNIYIGNLIMKYNYMKERFIINPVIGEYDNPTEQRQGLLTLPLTDGGNTLVYGMADSGKDEFLQSFVYSVITTYDSEEVNLYMIDYGAETMINFKDAPQVGDIILGSDDEKLSNLVKLLVSEMNKRKKRFVSYNGNYVDFIRNSGKTIPNIVVIINGIEVLNDNYLETLDKLYPVIRDGSKYGISFVITTTSQSSVRFKIVQSCKQLLCLQLANDNDYRDILGKTDGMVPSKYLGRGLVKVDKVCEFQTAFITTDEKKYSTIKETINLLNSKGLKKADMVPMMPDMIKLDMFKYDYLGIDSVPIGIIKDSLKYALFDFSKNVVNIISANEINDTRKFMRNFLKTLEFNNKFDKIVVDTISYFDAYDSSIKMYNSNFNQVIDSLKKIDDELQAILVKNEMNIRSLKDISNKMCVIIGFEKFLERLDDEHKKIFKDIIKHNKETLKINFVFVDIPSSFKKYEYEDWYKNSFDLDDGIWIGFGVTQQFVLKLMLQTAKLSNIDNEHAIIIKNGMPIMVKLINEFK